MCNNFIFENYRLTRRPTAAIQWSRIQNISIGIIQQKIGSLDTSLLTLLTLSSNIDLIISAPMYLHSAYLEVDFLALNALQNADLVLRLYLSLCWYIAVIITKLTCYRGLRLTTIMHHYFYRRLLIIISS